MEPDPGKNGLSATSLVGKSFVYQVLFMAVGAVFTLIAPRVIGELYPTYVLWSRLLMLFLLFLTLGSAGVFNRFVHELPRDGVRELFRHAMRMKIPLMALLLAGSVLYGLLADAPVLIPLALFAIVFSISEALFLLLYAQEHYEVKFAVPVLTSAVRLALLPLTSVSLVLFIGLSETVRFAGVLRVFVRKYRLRDLFGMLRPGPVDHRGKVDRHLLRKVAFDTYLSNLLFFALPLTPIFVLNQVGHPHLRDVSIMYVLATSLIYNLLSAVNNIILPKLVRCRDNPRALLRFLLLTSVLAGGCCVLFAAAFHLLEGTLTGFYAMTDYASIYWLLVYSAALVFLNSCRQVLFVSDAIGRMSPGMLVFYLLLLGLVFAAKLPVAGVLTALIAVLCLATAGLTLRLVRKEAAA